VAALREAGGAGIAGQHVGLPCTQKGVSAAGSSGCTRRRSPAARPRGAARRSAPLRRGTRRGHCIAARYRRRRCRARGVCGWMRHRLAPVDLRGQGWWRRNRAGMCSRVAGWLAIRCSGKRDAAGDPAPSAEDSQAGWPRAIGIAEAGDRRGRDLDLAVGVGNGMAWGRGERPGRCRHPTVQPATPARRPPRIARNRER